MYYKLINDICAVTIYHDKYLYELYPYGDSIEEVDEDSVHYRIKSLFYTKDNPIDKVKEGRII